MGDSTPNSRLGAGNCEQSGRLEQRTRLNRSGSCPTSCDANRPRSLQTKAMVAVGVAQGPGDDGASRRSTAAARDMVARVHFRRFPQKEIVLTRLSVRMHAQRRIPTNDSVGQGRQTTEHGDRIAKLAPRQHALLAKAEESRQVVRSLTFVQFAAHPSEIFL